MERFSAEEFVRAVGFVKKADCRGFATIDATAKMLSVRKFDVMTYIEENPLLVRCTEHTDYKVVSVPLRNPFNGKTVGRTTEMRVAKRYGLCIDEAFCHVEDNPWNPEWLERQIRLNEKTVYATAFDNYGEIQGHYLSEDLPSDKLFEDNRKNVWLWRNTRAKLEAARALGATRETTFWFGGAFDATRRVKPFAIDSEGVCLLENNGWTVVGKWF